MGKRASNIFILLSALYIKAGAAQNFRQMQRVKIELIKLNHHRSRVSSIKGIIPGKNEIVIASV